MFTGSRADALREANRIEAEQRRDPLSLMRGRTFGEYLMQDWLPWRDGFPGIGEKIRGHDRDIAQVLIRLIGNVPLASFGARDMDNLAASLHRTGYAPRTCALYWATARKALRQARRWRMIAGTPWEDAHAPTVPRSAPTITTAADAERLAAHLDRSNPVAAALVRVMLGSGCRKGELLALTWTDVTDDCGQLSVHKGVWEHGRNFGVKPSPKNASSRRAVTLPEVTRQVLLAHRAWISERQAALPGWNATSWVFPDRHGELWRPSTATTLVSYAAQKLGVPTGLHLLRHTHVTALLEAGVPVKAVSEHVGHADATVTLNTYAHTTKAGRDAILTALNGYLPASAPPTEPVATPENVIRISGVSTRRNVAGRSEEQSVYQSVYPGADRRKKL
jgi:integrase